MPLDVRVIWSGSSDDRRVALTFDDGPHSEITERVLDLLGGVHARATFFVLGQRVEASGERGRHLLRRMVSEGHEIGNHSWSHADISKLSTTQIHREIGRTQDVIELSAGNRPRLFRPPGGGVDFGAVRSLAGTGMEALVMWSIDPGDWALPGKEQLWRRVASSLVPGSIILLHDIHESTLAALPGLLDLIQAKGFEIVTVSELVKDRIQ